MNFSEDSEDKNSIKVMNEELDKIEKKNTWELVLRKKDNNIIEAKWVDKNTLKEEDDIFFGSDLEELGHKFVKDMQKEFKISMLGEFTFFIGLQVTQTNKGIFICKSKYLREKLKQFGMEDCKHASTPMVTGYKLRKYDESHEVNQFIY
eukprot:PITA_15234